jgi:hypothetical protein
MVRARRFINFVKAIFLILIELPALHIKMPKFVPRQRKSKVRLREEKSSDKSSQTDSNAAELLPVSKSEKESRRQKLKEELRAQQPNTSVKKQKRLNKYIVRLNYSFLWSFD